jgi:hypothetical protein
MNLPMEPVLALPAESPALQRCAMRQIVEAYFGITPLLDREVCVNVPDIQETVHGLILRW